GWKPARRIAGWKPAPLLSPFFFDEAQSLGIDLLRAGEEVAPNARRGRQRGEGPAERFNDQPAVVLHFFEGLESFIPVDHARAGSAAIVLADVDVDKVAGKVFDRGSRPLLLDVGVEGVVHGAEVGMVHLL